MARIQNVFMLANKIEMTELEGWSTRQWEQYWIEPKIDGVRYVRYGKKGWLSSGGKDYNNVRHISSLIDSIRGIDGYLIDGELYGDDWESTISDARTFKENRPRRLRYRVFDCVPLLPSQTLSLLDLEARREMMSKVLEKVQEYPYIRPVHVSNVSSFHEFKIVHEGHLADGCDGSMLKLRSGIYVQKRSSFWLKVKPVNEMDCKIVDFKPGKGKYLGTLGSIGVVLPQPLALWGAEVTHVSGMDDKDRDYIWRNREKLLGKVVEIRYRRTTRGNRLVEPRFSRIRWDKEA